MNCCKCAIKLSDYYITITEGNSSETYCNKCHKKMDLGDLIQNLADKIHEMIYEEFGDLYPAHYYDNAYHKIRDALYDIAGDDV